MRSNPRSRAHAWAWLPQRTADPPATAALRDPEVGQLDDAGEEEDRRRRHCVQRGEPDRDAASHGEEHRIVLAGQAPAHVIRVRGLGARTRGELGRDRGVVLHDFEPEADDRGQVRLRRAPNLQFVHRRKTTRRRRSARAHGSPRRGAFSTCLVRIACNRARRVRKRRTP